MSPLVPGSSGDIRLSQWGLEIERGSKGAIYNFCRGSSKKKG